MENYFFDDEPMPYGFKIFSQIPIGEEEKVKQKFSEIKEISDKSFSTYRCVTAGKIGMEMEVGGEKPVDCVNIAKKVLKVIDENKEIWWNEKPSFSAKFGTNSSSVDDDGISIRILKDGVSISIYNVW